MKDSTKKTFLWLIIILLVANLSAFITVIIRLNNNFGEESRKIPGKIESFNNNSEPKLLHDLHFSDEQMNLYRQNHQVHKKVINHHKISLNNIRKEILKELSNDHPKQKVLDSLSYAFGDIEGEIKRSTFKHFIDIKSMCNEEQIKILKTKIGSVVDSQRPGPGKRRRGRHQNVK